MAKKTCFVSMGFGKKTDYYTGRTLDLERTYRNIIKPAAKEAGFECIRADEVAHSGRMEEVSYQQLLNADVVIVDLSTLNPNALYELGVRHALRPHSTIVIAEDGTTALPFDLSTLPIRKYRHQGDGIDYEEVQRMQSDLRTALIAIAENVADDSPVYHFLKGLNPPNLGDAREVVAKLARPSEPELPTTPGESVAALIQQSEEAMRREDWDVAKGILEHLHSSAKSADPYIVQRLALATYKSRKPTQQQAIEDARDMLSKLGPGTLNDPEVLRVWGAVHSRQWEITGDRAALDTALTAYQKAFHLGASYQDGIILAFMLNARASLSDAAEGISDFVLAQRARRDVIEICNRMLDESVKRNRNLPEEYSIRAALAEAWFGLGEEVKYRSEIERANRVSPHPSFRSSTEDRIAELGMLLEFSPLQYLAHP